MVVSCGTETGDGSKGSGALYVSGFDGSFPYILAGEFVCTESKCQGASETGNVSRPSAHRTPMDPRNRRSRGWVPAECLEQKMRRKLSSHFAQVLLYI